VNKHIRPRTFGVGLLAASAMLLAACSAGESAPAATGAADSGAADAGPLVIASWGGAYSEATRTEIASAFTAETGIEVQVLDAGNHVATVQQMSDAGATEWDILEGMSYVDSLYMDEQGLLAKWPAELQEKLVADYGAENVTDFGHAWSGYGAVVVCNEATVEVCPTTLEELFDPVAFPGKRMLPGDPSTFNALVTSLAVVTGSDRDALFDDDTDISVFADELAEVKDSVSVWYTAGDQQNQAILQGQADMGLMFSGRAFQLVDEGVDLSISWDGVYMVGLTEVLEDAPHKETAFRFIEWLADNPEAQAKWSEAMNYTVASQEVFDYLPEETAERLATFPANYEQLVLQDFPWHAAHKDEIDAALLAVIQG
jgi:putative spermidine/putrescine transport system substrate-binding protein